MKLAFVPPARAVWAELELEHPNLQGFVQHLNSQWEEKELMTIDWDHIKDELKDIKHSLWDKILAASRVIPRPMRRFLFALFASVTPNVPITLEHLSDGSNGWGVFWCAASATFLFTFVMTCVLSKLAGTFSGTDQNIIYFLRDHENLLLYVGICPTYIGFCAWLIYLFLGRRNEISRLAGQLNAPRVGISSLRFPGAIVLAIFAAATLDYKYINDVLRITDTKKAYWFMTAPIAGTRYLTPVGTYYIILNFTLLLITALAIFCFFSLFLETIRVGTGIRNLQANQQIDFQSIRKRLETFVEAYLVGKALCATYIVNIWLWHLSPLNNTFSYKFSLYVGAAMGLIFVSFPRYYVELMWRDYESEAKTGAVLQEMRDSKAWVIAFVLDFFFISTFVGNWQQFVPSWLLHSGAGLVQKLLHYLSTT